MVRIRLVFDRSLSGNKETKKNLVNSMVKHEEFIKVLQNYIRSNIKIKTTANKFLNNLKLNIQYEEEKTGRDYIYACSSASASKTIFLDRMFWDEAIHSNHAELKVLLAITLMHEITHIYMRCENQDTNTPSKLKREFKVKDSGFLAEHILFSVFDFPDRYGVDLFAEFKPKDRKNKRKYKASEKS
jgi:hypothetical protein